MSEANEAKAQPKPADVSAVATLLGSVSRLSNMITSQLKGAGLELQEWLALQQIAKIDGKAKPKALSAAAGMNRQEFQTTLKSLSKKKYIAAGSAGKGEAAKVTDAGRLALEKGDAAIQGYLFPQVEGNARVGRAIRGVSKFVAVTSKRNRPKKKAAIPATSKK